MCVDGQPRQLWRATGDIQQGLLGFLGCVAAGLPLGGLTVSASQYCAQLRTSTVLVVGAAGLLFDEIRESKSAGLMKIASAAPPGVASRGKRRDQGREQAGTCATCCELRPVERRADNNCALWRRHREGGVGWSSVSGVRMQRWPTRGCCAAATWMVSGPLTAAGLPSLWPYARVWLVGRCVFLCCPDAAWQHPADGAAGGEAGVGPTEPGSQ